jgi:hypothetical protein
LNERRSTVSTPAPNGNQSITLAVPPEPWRDPEWQRLWLALQARPWTSLALIPSGTGGPEDFTLLVAVILSRTGMVHLGSPVPIADATQIPLSHMASFLEQVASHSQSGERILVALPAASKSPVARSIAQATDATLLCVLMEKMSLSEGRKTVDQIGASHFLGSAIFHPHQLDQARHAH